MRMKAFLSMIDDTSGTTAIEYSLIASLISVVILGAISTVGLDLVALFTDVAAKVSGAL